MNNLDLRIEPGQIVCLLGRSGTGKTAILDIISGLYSNMNKATGLERFIGVVQLTKVEAGAKHGGGGGSGGSGEGGGGGGISRPRTKSQFEADGDGDGIDDTKQAVCKQGGCQIGYARQKHAM